MKKSRKKHKKHWWNDLKSGHEAGVVKLTSFAKKKESFGKSNSGKLCLYIHMQGKICFDRYKKMFLKVRLKDVLFTTLFFEDFSHTQV